MENFNLCISGVDYCNLIQLFKDKGEVHTYKKKDYFINQNSISQDVGWIEKGVFRYTCAVKDGTKHVVGFGFPEDFLCDYSSLIDQSASLVNIQALSKCTVYQLSYQDILAYWGANMETLHFRKQVADNLFKVIYIRLLETYCETPEKRYIKLMKRYPDLKEKVPLKEIASYLNVTPTTISYIRRKITFKE